MVEEGRAPSQPEASISKRSATLANFRFLSATLRAGNLKIKTKTDENWRAGPCA